MNRLKMDDISDFSADAATKYYRQRAMKLLEILEGQVLNIMAISIFDYTKFKWFKISI